MKNYVIFSVTEYIIQHILGCVAISMYSVKKLKNRKANGHSTVNNRITYHALQ